MRIAVVLAVFLLPTVALAAPKRVQCPVIADREDGTFSKNQDRFLCYKTARDAKLAKFERRDYPDNSSLPKIFSGIGNFKSAPFFMPRGAKPLRVRCDEDRFFDLDIREVGTDDLLDSPVSTIGFVNSSSYTYSRGTVYVEVSTTAGCAWTIDIGVPE